MTFRNHKEHSTSSEVYSHYHQPGSVYFCDPYNVEHWNQSVPFGEVSLPTPPASDCASSDCQDMSGQTWSRTSLPEEWTGEPSMDHGFVYPHATHWHSQGIPVTTQEVHTLDQAAWLNANHGSVDMGLSPVLSHESQSTRTLNSFSEPDACVLPPSLDLSFASEPQWHGPVVYTSPAATRQSGHEYGFTSFHDGMGHHISCSSAPQPIYPGAHPLFFPQGGQAALPRRAFTYVPASPMRPILPRAEGIGHQSQPAYGAHRATQPQTQGSRSSHVLSVSNVAGQPLDALRHTSGVANSSGCTPASSHPAYSTTSGTLSPVQAPVSAPLEFGSIIKPEIAMSSFMDPTADDFGAFINYDHEDHLANSDALSYAPGCESLSSVPSSVSGEVKVSVSRPEKDTKAVNHSTAVTVSSSNDIEEGRYRNHPLYSQGPRSDGLYHCPYKAQDPNCPHKPTKLKCNYDKYIDSHLKPFRCKAEACSKQEFSSTACLLRHEREAHGMHGHGERPHLCYYPGCDRGIPGNGFPRRYNLFDHMKRVHDHKEDISSTSSPVLSGESQGQKKSRKRKASASPVAEPAPVRQRTSSMPEGLVHAFAAPTARFDQAHEFYPQATYEPERKDQNGQRLLYSQWANQRDLLTKQMGFVQGPDDVANIQRLSQNIEELRRLSEEARRR